MEMVIGHRSAAVGVRRVAALFGAVLALAALGAHAAPPRYLYTELQRPGDALVVLPAAINDAGTIAGRRSTKNGHGNAVVMRADGFYREARPFGGLDNRLYAINAGGSVAGSASLPGAAPNVAAFVAQGRVATNLFPDQPQAWSEALGINAAGDAVGYVVPQGGAISQAFVWRGGQVTLLPPLATGGAAVANAINDAGVVVGTADVDKFSSHHAFVHDGTMHDLGTPGSMSAAAAVNASGTVVGWSSVPTSGATHATLWQDGVRRDLGTLMPHPDDGNSTARGVGAAGQVVGNAAARGGETHAFIWIAGTMYDLNDYVDGLPPQFKLTDAFAINAAGQIVGLSRKTALGEARGVLLTPIAEAARP